MTDANASSGSAVAAEMARVRSLCELAAELGKSPAEQVESALILGCNWFGAAWGMVVRAQDDSFVISHVGGDARQFTVGKRTPVTSSLCRFPFEAGGPVAFHDLSQPELRDHPARQAADLGCYIGTTMEVGGERYGTLCFAHPVPRAEPYTDADRDMLQLLARWIAGVMERGRALDAVRESESRQRALYTRTPVMLECTDGHGNIIEVSDIWLEVMGYSREEVVGRKTTEFMTAESALHSWVAGLPLIEEQGFARDFPLQMVTKDGRVIDALTTIVAERTESGGFGRSTAMIQIVTAQKAAEAERDRLTKQLESERQVLRQVIASAPVAMAMLDRDMRYLVHSRRWLSDSALEGHDIIGLSHYEVFPDIPERWRQIHGRVLEGESFACNEDVFERADGTVLYLNWAAEPWLNSEGAVGGIVIVANQITDLVRARKAATDASSAKSAFLAKISHEIRTPLNGVIGMTDLLLDSRLNPEQRECAGAIRACGESLLTLINDILNYSKGEAGSLTLRHAEFDLRTVMEQVGDLLRKTAFAKGLDFRVMVPARITTKVRGDAERLRQVLTNLVDNAVKFTDEGEVVLTAETVAESETHVIHRLTVTDTGIGIPEEKVPELFEAFKQLDDSASRRHGGTGLGLAICRQIAGALGGTIAVKSEPGRGSEFALTLRMEKQDTAATGEIAQGKREAVHDMRVLIVDPHGPTANHIRETASLWCAEARCATTLRDAQQLCAEAEAMPRPYDVIMVDWSLASPGGKCARRFAHPDGSPCAATFVLMAGTARSIGQSDLESSGFARVISKPVKQSSLLDCLAAIAPTRRQPRDPATQDAATCSPSAAPARPPRVLLVEDNPVNQHLAQKMLQRIGCRCELASNGSQAINAVAAARYDVIFMDCQMPDIDGYEATAAIRSMEGRTRHTPIVALTANAMVGDREHCLQAGMDDYLPKPIRTADLLRILGKWAPATLTGPTATKPPPIDPTAGLTMAFDAKRLHEVCGNDTDFMTQLLESFLANSRTRLQQLRDALDDKDAAAGKALAHSLSGAGVNVGADAFAQIAAQVEQACAAHDWARINSSMHQLANALDTLQEATANLDALGTS